MIVIDSREPANLVETIRRAVPNITRALLPTADFAIYDMDGCGIGIERKTVLDFLQSFSSGRLVKQINRMREIYRPILLLEGQFSLADNMRVRTMITGPNGRVHRRDTGWHHSAIQMALLAVQREGVTVLWTPDHRGTADVLRILEKRASEGCAMVGKHSLLDVWPTEREDALTRPSKPRKRRIDKAPSENPPETSL